VNTSASPAGDLYLVVGYDGSAPATRALDAAVRLLQGRTGRIEVAYIAHLTSLEMFSAGAVGEMEADFDEVEAELRAEAGKQLSGREEHWGFVRGRGPIAAEATAISSAACDAYVTVAIVVGSSSHGAHRMVGSVAVSLARHSPVPVVIVP
jgi:nucleotide-binding universal stress UspA family protein